ncbi:Scm-like with four MBT domains protein 2 [Plecturocebus cupreus]
MNELVQWLTPVIPALWEAKVDGSQGQGIKIFLANMHFGRPRQVDCLKSGVRDQCGQHGTVNGKYCCPQLFINHRCFSGPYLNKGRIAELPQSVGPGKCVLVLKETMSGGVDADVVFNVSSATFSAGCEVQFWALSEWATLRERTKFLAKVVLSMIINAAYKPGRVLRELQLVEDPHWNFQEETLKANGETCIQDIWSGPGTGAHACNPHTLGSRGRQITSAQEFETSLDNILLWRLRQENRLNPADRGCSELRLHHCTPAWAIEQDSPSQNMKPPWFCFPQKTAPLIHPFSVAPRVWALSPGGLMSVSSLSLVLQTDI